jgi:hypothetical protein
LVTKKDEIIAARDETILHREDQINESDHIITQRNTIIEWDVGVLVEHGIAGVGRRRWLTTVSRDGGGGLAAVLSREEVEG